MRHHINIYVDEKPYTEYKTQFKNALIKAVDEDRTLTKNKFASAIFLLGLKNIEQLKI